MPDTALCRKHVGALFESALSNAASTAHPGLLLSRGVGVWPADKTKKGELFQEHIKRVASLKVSDIYKAAYQRWFQTAGTTSSIVVWPGELNGRLFIGMGGASVIETAITLSRTYGVPFIPGSAQKGLASAYAKAAGLTDACRTLFGGDGETSDGFESGYVIFHDAWWIPDSAETPLVPEVVTVHHPEYYKEAGATDATDFDSPIPNGQIAARGQFLFAVECADPDWAALARDLLGRALLEWGIGGKTNAGYGVFVPPAVPAHVVQTWEGATVTTWEGATVTWNPGNSTLSTTANEGATCRLPDNQAKDEVLGELPDSLTNRLFRDRRLSNITVFVERVGNRYSIRSVHPGTV
ncbi:MAG: type III-B CRISPR module RAMP protein Cmr6 [Nitrospirae bacterium]|nr:type III-B CRISPR module RAMP protein Cmr6 [Nitrospirota bacterium]